MALLLSNLSLDHDVAMAKALSIAIVSTMSSHTIEAACARDIVRRVSELYFRDYSMKKLRLRMVSKCSKAKTFTTCIIDITYSVVYTGPLSERN